MAPADYESPGCSLPRRAPLVALRQVASFYAQRFSIELTDVQEAEVVAFLNSL